MSGQPFFLIFIKLKLHFYLFSREIASTLDYSLVRLPVPWIRILWLLLHLTRRSFLLSISSATIYLGLHLTSSYILAIYVPIIPRLIIKQLPIMRSNRITVVKPLKAIPINFMYKVWIPSTRAPTRKNTPIKVTN